MKRSWFERAISAAAWSGIVAAAAHADNFRRVSYDAVADELIVVVDYRGTNPDHSFSVNWGPCIDHGADGREIVAEILDQQFEDAAEKDYTKTVRIGLEAQTCRPAAVTLRMAPRFYYTLTVPARPGGAAP